MQRLPRILSAALRFRPIKRTETINIKLRLTWVLSLSRIPTGKKAVTVYEWNNDFSLCLVRRCV